MEHINYRIAERISDELELQERSQRWLADKSGIPLTTLTRKLRGHRPFDVVELSGVVRALDLDLAQVITQSPSTHKQAA